MKSFNEFVSIKEDNNNPTWESALNLSQKINKSLQGIPATMKEVMDIRRYASELELSIFSYVKSGNAEKSPLMLIQRINKYLQQIPATVKEVMDIRVYASNLELTLISLML